MSKVLFVDDDPQMLKTMGKYLSWYGLEIDLLDDSSQAESRLTSKSYSLLICSVFATPIDGYGLCSTIRRSDNPRLSNLEIMLIAPEELELEKYLLLKRLNIYFMNKYENTQIWHERISAILRKPKGYVP